MPRRTAAGQLFDTEVVLTLPSVPTRSLDAYRIHRAWTGDEVRRRRRCPRA